ncbi:YxeK2 [Paenibacillus mucilaginosus 3016]|uniref:YxeK2 n=1 Tax=Paenibacillus mucilaginosus 3016 TaxID=1116391 RepID=H6NPY2_9BACL|nr:YxeK2 [Paenibacillus mucilaginosus 3016]
MTTPNRQMRLGAFLSGAGHHVAAWRYPDARERGILDFEHYKHLAQTAERAKFDMIFFADILAVSDDLDTAVSYMSPIRPEPVTLLSALSVVTERIGLTGTLSSTYSEPFNVARQFAMLDHLSRGRAAWNVVTTSSRGAAANFGQEKHLEHHLRYERAREYVDVVTKLWDSWEDDALLFDKELGLFADRSKVHRVDHRGDWFSVKGPLNIARSPQGRPVLIQAGSSEDGRDFAAQTAEVIFTAWQTLGEARAFYDDVKGRAVRYGRSREDVKILPGVMPIIGATDAEAREKYDHFQSLIHPKAGITLLSGMIGHDLSGYDPHEPFPDLPRYRRRCQRPPASHQGHRKTRCPLHPGGQPPHCGGPRPPDHPRLARQHRGSTAGMVRGRRLRRLQHHGAVLPRRPRGIRRPRDPRAAEPRPVPYGVRGPHPAREPGPAAPGEPICEEGAGGTA